MSKIEELISVNVYSNAVDSGGHCSRALIIPSGSYIVKAAVDITGAASIAVSVEEKQLGLDLSDLTQNIGPITTNSEWEFECCSDARLYVYVDIPTDGSSGITCKLWLLRKC